MKCKECIFYHKANNTCQSKNAQVLMTAELLGLIDCSVSSVLTALLKTKAMVI